MPKAKNGTRKPRPRIDWDVLDKQIPEGIALKAQALIETEQRGHLRCKKMLQSIIYHHELSEKYKSLDRLHQDGVDKIVDNLGVMFGERQRTPTSHLAVKRFLSGLQPEVVRSIAIHKGIDVGETMDLDAVCEQLAQA